MGPQEGGDDGYREALSQQASGNEVFSVQCPGRVHI
jgi:hypothetical protein